MKKLGFMVLLLALICAVPVHLLAQSGSLVSLTPVFKPAAVSFTTTTTSTLNASGFSMAVVTVKGTYTGMTLNVQGTNDNTTFTNLQLLPLTGGAPTTAVTANGVFYANIAALTQLKLNNVCSSCTGTITVQITASGAQGTEIPLYPPPADPCQDRAVAKSSKPINITSATTTQIVALVSGQSIYVCELSVVIAGGTVGITLEYGTGSNCGTGTTVLSGPVPPSTYYVGFGGTFVQTPASNALCILSGASLTGANGVLTYVQM